MLRMNMGNRLLVPGPVPAVSAAADDCRAAVAMDTDTSATTASPDESTEPEPAALPARNSFEIMNQFNWDMHLCDDEEVKTVQIAVPPKPVSKYPAVFRWTGVGEEVSIAGTFNSWRGKIPLVKSQGEFYTVVEVPEGTHQYKYYIDGDWVCHPNEPKVDNGLGTQNNVLTMNRSDCDIYHVLQSDSLGAVAVDRTASPPGGYSQYIPAKDSGIGFHRLGPPLLPPHLLETVLNKDVPPHCEPMMVQEPNHVVLNHLYTLSIKGGIMVLSTTHRYRKKYITTLLYKPITS